MALPIDFEKLAKLPAGNGYPYSIRSQDLMRNFAWCDLLPSSSSDVLRIELEEVPGETATHKQRRMVVAGSDTLSTQEVMVVQNGEFKLGNFYISGPLTPI